MNPTPPPQSGARDRLYGVAFVGLGMMIAAGVVHLKGLLVGSEGSTQVQVRETQNSAPAASAKTPSPPNLDTVEGDRLPDVDVLVAGPDGKAWADFLIELRDTGFLHDERERCEMITKHGLRDGESCEFAIVHDIARGDEGRGQVVATRLVDPLPVGSECEALARCVANDRVGLTGMLGSAVETPAVVADLVRLKPPHPGLSNLEMLDEWISMFQTDLARAEAADLDDDPPTYLRMLVERRGIEWMQSLREQAGPR